MQQHGSTDGAQSASDTLSVDESAAASLRPPPPVVVPRVFPPLSGPSKTYVFSGQLEYRVSLFTETSKYVLYENGAFSLQYVSPAFELVGAYLLQDGRIGFAFSPSGSASGTLNGDVLEVRYEERMQHSDFENAVYKRSP